MMTTMMMMVQTKQIVVVMSNSSQYVRCVGQMCASSTWVDGFILMPAAITECGAVLATSLGSLRAHHPTTAQVCGPQNSRAYLNHNAVPHRDNSTGNLTHGTLIMA